MTPELRLDTPSPARASRSSTSTSWPRLASATAQARPTTPAPTTMTSISTADMRPARRASVELARGAAALLELQPAAAQTGIVAAGQIRTSHRLWAHPLQALPVKVVQHERDLGDEPESIGQRRHVLGVELQLAGMLGIEQRHPDQILDV